MAASISLKVCYQGDQEPLSTLCVIERSKHITIACVHSYVFNLLLSMWRSLQDRQAKVPHADYDPGLNKSMMMELFRRGDTQAIRHRCIVIDRNSWCDYIHCCLLAAKMEFVSQFNMLTTCERNTNVTIAYFIVLALELLKLQIAKRLTT